MDVDVVPVVEALLQPVDGGGIGAGQVVHGRIREDHAEAEGLARVVPLEQSDGMGGVLLLEQDREVERGGAGAHAHDLHAFTGFRIWAATSRCWISVVPS